jgi:hypothetical protein
VFELLRASRKPAVGHNCLFDLAFTLEHLAEPLPGEWPAFKQLVKKWFPGTHIELFHTVCTQITLEALGKLLEPLRHDLRTWGSISHRAHASKLLQR